MLKNDFEKYIKDNLESARWDWDKEEMWADIEQHLPPVDEPKRPLWLWWLSGVFILGLLGTTLFWLNGKTQSDKVVVEKTNINSKSNVSNETAKLDVNTFDNQTKVTNNNLENTNTQTSNSSSLNTIEKSDKSRFDSNATNNQVNLPDAKETALTIDNETLEISKTQNSKPIVATDANVNNAGEIAHQEILKSDALDLKMDEDRVAFDRSQYFTWISLEPKLGGVIYENQRTFKQPSLATAKFVKPSTKIALSTLAFYSNYSLSSRTLTSGSNVELFQSREESEAVLEGFGAQITYRHFWNRKFFTAIGLDYQRINEVQDFEQATYESIQIESDTAAYFINFNGEVQHVSGRQTATVVTTTPFVRYNEHHFISMPIHFGYNYEMGKFSFSLVSGPILNLFQSYKGDRINLVDNDMLLEKDVSVDNYQSSLLSAFDAGLYLNYNLGNNISLSSGINYRKSLSDFTIDGLNKQSYDNLDFKLGLLLKI